MSKFTTNKPSNYIKTKELKEGDRIMFVTGGEWVKRDFSKLKNGSDMKTVFVAKVTLNNGEEKEMTINSTSGNNLAETWGEPGDAWKGKIAKVSFVKMVSFGKMMDVLCLLPTDETGW